MSGQEDSTVRDADHQWFIVRRWQAYEGEARANLLRIMGIALFYIVELANYHGLRLGWFDMPPVVDKAFHQSVTALAVAWTLMSLGVLYCLTHRIFPWMLKYVTTGLDVLLLTVILMVADGPKSPLVVGYFLIIALALLRFDLSLIRFSTGAAVVGYLSLTGYARWWEVELRLPRYHQAIMLLAIALAGVISGQAIRCVRGMAEEFASRAGSETGEDA